MNRNLQIVAANVAAAAVCAGDTFEGFVAGDEAGSVPSGDGWEG
jgi:hypothetical protein